MAPKATKKKSPTMVVKKGSKKKVNKGSMKDVEKGSTTEVKNGSTKEMQKDPMKEATALPRDKAKKERGVNSKDTDKEQTAAEKPPTTTKKKKKRKGMFSRLRAAVGSKISAAVSVVKKKVGLAPKKGADDVHAAAVEDDVKEKEMKAKERELAEKLLAEQREQTERAEAQRAEDEQARQKQRTKIQARLELFVFAPAVSNVLHKEARIAAGVNQVCSMCSLFTSQEHVCLLVVAFFSSPGLTYISFFCLWDFKQQHASNIFFTGDVQFLSQPPKESSC
jgi:hypothetical protein